MKIWITKELRIIFSVLPRTKERREERVGASHRCKSVRGGIVASASLAVTLPPYLCTRSRSNCFPQEEEEEEEEEDSLDAPPGRGQAGIHGSARVTSPVSLRFSTSSPLLSFSAERNPERIPTALF